MRHNEAIEEVTYAVGKGQVEFLTAEQPPMEPGDVAVSTQYVGVSPGTDGSFYSGTNIFMTHYRDPRTRKFVERAVPDFAPRKIGYMNTSVDEQGTILGCKYGYKSGYVLKPADSAVPLPEGMDPLLAVYLAQFGPICANVLAWADIRERDFLGNVSYMGESLKDKNVAVWGGGPVGMMTALMIKRAGGNVALVDQVPSRLAIAADFGLHPIDNSDGQAADKIKGAGLDDAGWSDGADASVFTCGTTELWDPVFESARPEAVMYDLSFYQGAAKGARLGSYYHHDTPLIQPVQIGHKVHPDTDPAQFVDKTIDVLRHFPVREKFVSHIIPVSELDLMFQALVSRRPELLEEYAQPGHRDLYQPIGVAA